MEGCTQIARAYYGRASEGEKDLVKAFFKELDVNGEGEISVPELIKKMGSCFSSCTNIYNLLNQNSDGKLNFFQVLPAYYIMKKFTLSRCDVCRALLPGPYFSCLLCLGKCPDTFDLCCACYREGKFEHEHKLKYLLDHYSLLSIFRQRTVDAERRKGKVYEDMYGCKELATTYYKRATEKEKELVKEFFNQVDDNGDVNISLTDLTKKMGSWLLSNEKIHEQLHSNNDGKLNLFQALPLYYIRNKFNLLRCDGCSGVLLGPYFSCLLCLGKGPATFDLCCACHGEGKSEHEHDTKNMLDTYSLLKEFRQRNTNAEISKKRGAMGELMGIAKAHYESGSPDVQALARDFFNSMDADRNGKVDVEEFLTFMREKEQGHVLMRNRDFFNELDTDNKGSLGFWDVMTVFYIIKSGRPFCDRCTHFIPGLYFSCVDCYKSTPRGSYHLCCECYQSKKCKHNHNGSTHFLDNYTLLEATRDSSLAQATGVYQNHGIQATINEFTTLESPSNVTIIVPYRPPSQRAGAIFGLLNTAINFASLAGCTIM